MAYCPHCRQVRTPISERQEIALTPKGLAAIRDGLRESGLNPKLLARVEQKLRDKTT